MDWVGDDCTNFYKHRAQDFIVGSLHVHGGLSAKPGRLLSGEGPPAIVAGRGMNEPSFVRVLACVLMSQHEARFHCSGTKGTSRESRPCLARAGTKRVYLDVSYCTSITHENRQGQDGCRQSGLRRMLLHIRKGSQFHFNSAAPTHSTSKHLLP